LQLAEEELVVDGVFLIKPGVSPRSLMDGLEMEGRHIRVNRRMETGIPGVYAAGDCTSDPYQIAKAVGEGQVAAAQAVRYLSDKDRPAREQPRVLSIEDRENLTRILRERIVDPVRILHFTQDSGDNGEWTGPACRECREARELIEEFASLSSKIQLEVKDFLAQAEEAEHLGVSRLPATLVGRPGEIPRVRFFGTPTGYEFGVLVEDVLQVSAGKEELTEQTREALAGLPGPVHIEVMATPTCPMCPPATRLAHRFALASKSISADLVMVSEFPEVGQRYQVRSVPAFVLNGEPAPDGPVDELRLLELVKRAAGGAKGRDDSHDSLTDTA
jgi:glutaredoxin-like protein